MADGAVAVASWVATAVVNLALAWMVGAWAMRGAPRWIVPAGAGVAAVASVALLCLEAAAMADLPLPKADGALWPLLRSTHYGRVWAAGLCALVGVGATGFWRTAASRMVSAVGLVAFAGSRALMSHAASGGDATAAVAVDTVHLLLMSVWVGEVWIAGFLTLPAAGMEQVERLSRTATWALAGVVLSGIFNTWRMVGGPAPAAGTTYVQMLLIKLVLVSVAAGLGGFNRFAVMPSLSWSAPGSGEAAAAMRRFVFVLRVEALVLLGAIAAAAALAATAPP